MMIELRAIKGLHQNLGKPDVCSVSVPTGKPDDSAVTMPDTREGSVQLTMRENGKGKIQRDNVQRQSLAAIGRRRIHRRE